MIVTQVHIYIIRVYKLKLKAAVTLHLCPTSAIIF